MIKYRDRIGVRLTRISHNQKTGPIPVSTTSSETCPPSCPLKGNGCYANNGHLRFRWDEVNRSTGVDSSWDQFLREVRAIPPRRLWRHNQAGDMPGEGEHIDAQMLSELVSANKGRRGFTYTHKAPRGTNAIAIRKANEGGFTINLSADSLIEADVLADAGVGPVVAVLPKDQISNTTTPKGRKVVICPHYKTKVQCVDCELCANPKREFIIGFPAHGSSKNKVDKISRAL